MGSLARPPKGREKGKEVRTITKDEFIARYEANKAKKAEQKAKATKKANMDFFLYKEDKFTRKLREKKRRNNGGALQ